MLVADHRDRLIDQILTQVIAVLGAGRLLDRVVIGTEIGMEVIGLSLHKAVKPIEALLQRPVVERAGGGGLHDRGEMPLADTKRRPALGAKHLGDGRGLRGNPAAHVGETGIEIRDGSHADGVMVAAGEQASPRR